MSADASRLNLGDEDIAIGKDLKMEHLVESSGQQQASHSVVATFWIAVGITVFYYVHAKLEASAPAAIRKCSLDRRKLWRWTNIATSCVHAAITGIGALLSFYWYPETSKNIVYGFTKFGHALASFSLGYFIVDTVDLFLNDKKKGLKNELFIHHGFIIACFGLTSYTGRYVPYAQFALLCEVNSVFLHGRQLMLIQGVSKTDLLYRVNSVLNLGTFLTFRLAVLLWMLRWLFLNSDIVPLPAFTLGSIAMPVMIIMNVILMIRLLNSDYQSNRGRRPVANIALSLLQPPEEMDVPSQKWS